MCYDGLLLLAIWFAATWIFLFVIGNATQSPQRYFLQICLWLVAAAYFIFCWCRGGQTLPMQTWRIRLLTQDGRYLSWQQAIRRYVLASLGLMFFGAGFLWAFFDRDGQFLHDRLSGSRLLMVDK